MAFGFADTGIRCGQCGHFLNMLSQAIPELPDPLAVTCPYCGYSASYPKSAICSDRAIINGKPSLTRWASILLVAIAIILVLGLIATSARSAEPDPAPLHTSAEDCGYANRSNAKCAASPDRSSELHLLIGQARNFCRQH
jgi:hypothetical protein